MKTEVRDADIDAIVAQSGRTPDAVLPILRKIQDTYGYLPREALRRVCEIAEITPANIAGVSTFYSRFRHRPAGRHVISMCVGTACHVKGAEPVKEAARRFLEIPSGADTDPGRLFTLTTVGCFGCCTLAPVARIDDAIQGCLTPATVGPLIRDHVARGAARFPVGEWERGNGLSRGAAEIRIGQGSCCIAGGSLQVRLALEQTVRNLGADVRVTGVGCVGMCHEAPLVEIVRDGAAPMSYARVQPEQTERLVLRHFAPRGVLSRTKTWFSSILGRLLTDDGPELFPRNSITLRDPRSCEFLGRQKRIATEHGGMMGPLDLEGYERAGGFEALKAVLARNDPGRVVEEIRDCEGAAAPAFRPGRNGPPYGRRRDATRSW